MTPMMSLASSLGRLAAPSVQDPYFRHVGNAGLDLRQQFVHFINGQVPPRLHLQYREVPVLVGKKLEALAKTQIGRVGND